MFYFKTIFLGLLSSGLALSTIASAQSPQPESLHVVVNSNQDNVAADDVVTLREAIELVNGQRKREQLTPREQKQVTRPVTAKDLYNERSRSLIQFDLKEKPLIQLQQSLPPLLKDGLTIDGGLSAIQVPQVAIVPEPKADVLRGLTILAHGVTVRGLSLAGFQAMELDRLPIVAADIVIGHRGGETLSDRAWSEDITPKDVVIEDNWLGIIPSTAGMGETLAISPSSFGIYAFYSENAIIQRNQIQNHKASGIITGVTARGMVIQSNRIAHNGQQGMPDGIRLEGDVDKLKVRENKIQENAGSGVYLFKPTGSVAIESNQINNNGKRQLAPAIFLSGNGHLVEGNQIMGQNGAGIIISAEPKSWHNQLRNNQFANLQGMAIDLISRHYIQSSDRTNGDGPNLPIRDYPSRLHIANGGMDAPTWISGEFFQSSVDGSIELVGKAEPNSAVEIYSNATASGLLDNYLGLRGKVTADAKGIFTMQFKELQVGEQLRAVASADDYGTSEFSNRTVIRRRP
jgi:hypothetical protein